MKRGQGLKSDPQKQREWQDRSRKPLPMFSSRRRAQRKERAVFVAMVLKHRPMCEARLPMVCAVRTTDVNELQRGSGREDCWLDWDKVSSLCRGCHGWITDHPDWAKHHGHQLPNDDHVVTAQDWDVAALLRLYFVKHPCKPKCLIDHRLEYAV